MIKIDLETYKDDANNIINDGLYPAAVNLMDDVIREELHKRLSPCSDTVFLAAYMAAHKSKYNEDFTI